MPAVFYLYAGGRKAVQSQERLLPMMGWVDRVPMPLVRIIGVLDAAGLILPPLTGIAPRLAIAAATRSTSPAARPPARPRRGCG
ncbi:DoxX family protein [Nonomuraea aridisoli]|uniref:Uncharacterized protein n=1 Tax=Nonomuraea aridisoli TaxID=2070368 RepID=A0A2W2DQA7_9ACTN|nr:DoxX family protein [Nonomuraea aridisoli]PZG14136.1 hypothetical protein C1J01_27870 [Nonomuraea aridisoli]